MSIKLFLGSFISFIYNDIVTQIPIHFIRKSFLRLINKRISSTSKILMHTRFLHLWNISIGDNVVINQHCLLDGRRYPVTIDHNTDIGPYTRIWTLGHDPDSEIHEVKGGPVIIGHHVWIASGVTILPNVKINSGAVVASGSIVHKDVQTLTVVGGNPAKEIRKRNNPLTYKLNYTPYFE